jgi:hypothetical protein
MLAVLLFVLGLRLLLGAGGSLWRRGGRHHDASQPCSARWSRRCTAMAGPRGGRAGVRRAVRAGRRWHSSPATHQDRARRLGAAGARGAMFTVFMTWRDGRLTLRAELARRAVPIWRSCRSGWRACARARHGGVPGQQRDFVPTALLRNLEHNHVVHERVVMLNMQIVRSPRHDPAEPPEGRRHCSRGLRGPRALRLHGDARRDARRCAARSGDLKDIAPRP